MAEKSSKPGLNKQKQTNQEQDEQQQNVASVDKTEEEPSESVGPDEESIAVDDDKSNQAESPNTTAPGLFSSSANVVLPKSEAGHTEKIVYKTNTTKTNQLGTSTTTSTFEYQSNPTEAKVQDEEESPIGEAFRGVEKLGESVKTAGEGVKDIAHSVRRAVDLKKEIPRVIREVHKIKKEVKEELKKIKEEDDEDEQKEVVRKKMKLVKREVKKKSNKEDSKEEKEKEKKEKEEKEDSDEDEVEKEDDDKLK